jgi:signal transduction histidine kinase
VADSGRGVPETLRESVFDKFRSKGPNSGIGLGLYICKKIVQLHGGRISVGQSEWGGALFSVFLKQ